MKSNIEISSIIKGRTLGLIFVLSAASMAFSQQKLPVTGKVLDQQNQPVPYASVTFSHPNNKLLSDATLTDEQGNFSLELAPAEYSVSLEAIDYQKNIISKNVATAGSLGNFIIKKEESSTLTPTQEIQGVVITAQASKPYKVDLDKKVYDPSTDVISKGGNLQDVLTNVPSVSVDTDGTVSMRGNSNVRFLINGKPSSLLGIDDNSNALQSIPADQIERIEVITNPSCKFEASGTAGILNIILKKNKGKGFNGTVTGSLGYLPRTNLNTNLSWRKGNLTWFLNGGGGYDKRKNTRRNNTTYYNVTDSYPYLEQTNDNKNEGKNYNVNTGFNYDISEKTSVNAGVMLRYRTMEGNETNYYKEFDANRILQLETSRLSSANGEGTAWQGDLGLDHKFNTNGHAISASASFQQNKNKDYNNILENGENGVFLDRNLIDQNTTNKTFIGKLDYELPIGENSRLEAGYRIDRNQNDYDYDVLESADDINFTLDPDFTSTTVYKEMFNAFYGQFKSKIGDLGYQLGLRTEISDVDVSFTDINGNETVINKNYTGLFPSVFLSYDLGADKNNQLLVNYSRRINRPRSWFLVPFNSFSQNDNRNQFMGNADLNPEYINSYELGYAIQKKKYTINPTIYFRKSQDETQMIVVQKEPGSQILVTKPYNVGWESQLGLDLNATADFFPWWKVMGSVDLFRYESKGEFFDPEVMEEPFSVDGDGFSARARLTNTFKVDKSFSFQIQGMFRGGEKTASTKRLSSYSVNLGATKTIWNGDGTIAFNIQDVFNTRRMESYTYGSGFERYQYMQWQPRQASISLTYRFKQGEKIEQPKKKRDNNANFEDDDQQQM